MKSEREVVRHVRHVGSGKLALYEGGTLVRHLGDTLLHFRDRDEMIVAWNAALSASVPGEAVAWREVVIDALVVAHIYQKKHDTDPRLALHELICWEVDVALDPRVSDRALALCAAPAVSASVVTEERGAVAELVKAAERARESLREQNTNVLSGSQMVNTGMALDIAQLDRALVRIGAP